MIWRRGPMLLLLAPLALAAVTLAQPQPRATPILHEDVPSPTGDDTPSPALGDGGDGAVPAALASGDKILPRPEAVPASPDEPIFGGGGASSDRNTEWSADRDTGSDGTLHYASVFNPDVVPFKRMSVLDSVRADYTMFTSRGAVVQLPVGGSIGSMRDAFWASMVVSFNGTAPVPIPSVSPDMRILSVETTPPTDVVFSRDQADNFYVSSKNPIRAEVRLVFMVDADAGYFAPSLPASRTTPAKLRAMTPAEARVTLPPGVLAQAKRTLTKLDLDENMELGVVFNRLVEYFRSFEAKPAPPSTGDIYRDLVDSQAGVCRHRSFAFMITANAIGIATRYVSNEAHAFVEVWLGDRRWQRIDLGGAALNLDVSNAEGKTLHRPRAEDPFAKPKEYGANYTELRGDIRGLSEEQLEEKHAGLDDEPASGEPTATGAMGGATGAGTGTGTGTGTGSATGPDNSTVPPQPTDPAKSTPLIRVHDVAPVSYRGEKMLVTGTVGSSTSGLAQLPVNVFLAPAGRQGEDSILVGSGITDDAGDYAVEVDLPASLDLANYEVFVATNGDARFNAAISN